MVKSSSRKLAIKNLKGSDEELRISWMLKNMGQNKTFYYMSQKKNLDKSVLLTELKKKYQKYREQWRENPKLGVNNHLCGKLSYDTKIKPLCIDIELAAVCDLGCPHCYRQFISTPDKIMSKELAFKLIEQASELKVPSMKFNWRGEPLLNPYLPDIVDYAKQNGVLETIINTNATKLDHNLSKKLINSGLDLLIYSFDGGTKKSYEKMRPGRFKKNNFEDVYKNIRDFSTLKKEMNSMFPRTKIQMVLTDETYQEQEEYFSLFKDIVDDVSVKQYTERGGKISDVGEEYIKKEVPHSNDVKSLLKINQISKNSEVMKDADGNIFVSTGRLPCEQPYQRMLITYDGRVSMCCYDWGSMHPVGYVDELAIKNGEKEYKKVKSKADSKKKGFELMNLEMPKVYNTPKEEVNTIKDIWFGKEINLVREKHSKDSLEDVEICKRCPFKETYKWKQIS